jgi:hypothetical protein
MRGITSAVGHQERKSKRTKFTIDSLEKAMRILDAMEWSELAYERLDYMFEEYPELMDCTHQHIGEVMRMERETVTRAIGVIFKKDMHRKYKRVASCVSAILLVFCCSMAGALEYTLTSLPTGTIACYATAISGAALESEASNTVQKYVDTGTATVSLNRVWSYIDNSPVYIPTYKVYCGLVSSGTYTYEYTIALGNAIRGIGTGPSIGVSPNKTLQYFGQ